MTSCLLVTGGAGFIGSCYTLVARGAGIRVVNLDKLTYSSNPDNLTSLSNDPDHLFVHGCIGNDDLVSHLLMQHQPDTICNFAAESHVDRSILDPDIFARTNVLATCSLLRVTLNYWQNLPPEKQERFRFLHVSTDEVFGSLRLGEPAFSETTPYSPNSPYSASKAASDHFVRAFHETYGLPVLITNCSNNYGPRQFPEKLIPLTICRALERQPLPIYGAGENIRDWLHVEDHCEAILLVSQKGRIGQSYTIGGRSEKNNLEVVQDICSTLDRLRPHVEGSYSDLITFVGDRLEHDFRYAINCSHIETELGWQTRYTFQEGLEATVRWYLDNDTWIKRVHDAEYRAWIERNYTKGESAHEQAERDYLSRWVRQQAVSFNHERQQTAYACL